MRSIDTSLNALYAVGSTDNVVVAEIRARLYFDQFGNRVAGIGQPMLFTGRNTYGFILVQYLHPVRNGHFRSPFDDDPMLASMTVPLQ